MCLANVEGGLVVAGVNDWTAGRAAFERCPHGLVQVEWVKSRIRQFIRSPVRCRVAKVSQLVSDPPFPEAGEVIVPFYCTDFCSALHQEMQGYVRVSAPGAKVALSWHGGGK